MEEITDPFGPWVAAAGTMGDGRYPFLTIIRRPVDGTELGRARIGLTGAKQYCTVPFTPPGEVSVQLLFDDDFAEPGKGDRNVLVYEVLIR